MNKLFEDFLLKKYENISFDIFDTLIERDVKDPLEIFSLVGNETGEFDFRNKRIQAEKLARRNSRSREITIDEIYLEYKEENYSIEYLKSIELIMEERHIHLKKNMMRFYHRCIVENKNVFLVSDMYLPADFIESLLISCGIRDYKKLYVSCEYKKNKVTSELFRILLDQENISKEDIVHIGDSPKADFWGARKAGIFSVLVCKKNMLGRIMGKLKRIKGTINYGRNEKQY